MHKLNKSLAVIMNKIFKKPDIYIVAILIILSIRAIQLHHYDSMVAWGGWAAYYFYDFFIDDDNH